MLFESIALLILIIIAILMIRGKELKINITMHHKYDAPPELRQVNVEDDADKDAVLGIVETLNKYINGGE